MMDGCRNKYGAKRIKPRLVYLKTLYERFKQKYTSLITVKLITVKVLKNCFIGLYLPSCIYLDYCSLLLFIYSKN